MTHLKQHVFNSATDVCINCGADLQEGHLREQHVKEDLGRIPTAADWLSQIQPQRWMYGQLPRSSLPGRIRVSPIRS